jgi:hypothetical protein
LLPQAVIFCDPAIALETQSVVLAASGLLAGEAWALLADGEIVTVREWEVN